MTTPLQRIMLQTRPSWFSRGPNIQVARMCSMASQVPNITLNDQVIMPVVGLGGAAYDLRLKPGEEEELRKVFKTAIDIGYRHIDTASSYNTERALGAAIVEKVADGTVKREDLFITTKLWCDDMRPERVLPALRTSLEKLQLTYVDNYLIHWPTAVVPGSKWPREKGEFDNSLSLVDTWRAVEECKRLGLARSIGLSNFNRRQVQLILDNCYIKPSINQCEVHVYLQNRKLRNFCKENGVTIVAYSPIGAPYRSDINLANDPVLTELANKYERTNYQIALRFLVQEGVPLIAKSINTQRMKDNISLFDFSISDEDMSAIRKLDSNKRTVYYDNLFGGSKEFPFREEY